MFDNKFRLALLWLIAMLLLPSACSSQAAVDDLEGVWIGNYICGQGITNLSLLIEKTGGTDLHAIFKFSAHPDNPGVPSGSFSMQGQFDQEDQRISLIGTTWLDQPQGYRTVDLLGYVSNDSISGSVIGASCTTFSLKKA